MQAKYIPVHSIINGALKRLCTNSARHGREPRSDQLLAIANHNPIRNHNNPHPNHTNPSHNRYPNPNPGQSHVNKQKAKSFNTYIAPKTAYCSCSCDLCHKARVHPIGRGSSPHPRTLTCNQTATRSPGLPLDVLQWTSAPVVVLAMSQAASRRTLETGDC